MFAPHEPDHIIASQHHGSNNLENLAFACYHCNHYKGTNLASVDPETGGLVYLFHPRRDRWTEHFTLDGARIRPLNAKGRATAALLKFNVPTRLAIREKLVLAHRYPGRHLDLR